MPGSKDIPGSWGVADAAHSMEIGGSSSIVPAIAPIEIGCRLNGINGKSLVINPDDVRKSDPAAAAQTRDDDASRINDLESTRAALDRRTGPALSLSISGWVGEQVISAH